MSLGAAPFAWRTAGVRGGPLRATLLSTCLVAAAVALFLGGGVPSAHAQGVPSATTYDANSDYMMNYRGGSPFYLLFAMNPGEFSPDAFLTDLLDFYTGRYPSLVAPMLQLVEWCAWPNATYSDNPLIPSYCINGTNSAAVAAGWSHVLVGYKLYLNSSAASPTSISVALPAPYNTPVTGTPSRTFNDPAIFNRDRLTDNNGGMDSNNWVQDIYNDDTGFWVGFGVVVVASVLAVAAFFLLFLCRRNARNRRNNQLTQRSLRQQFQQAVAFAAERTGRRDVFTTRSMRRRKRRGHTAMDLDTEEPGYNAGRYDYGFDGANGGGLSAPDPASAAAAAGPTGGRASPHTSRASTYWPGTEQHGNAGDEEMTDRFSPR